MDNPPPIAYNRHVESPSFRNRLVALAATVGLTLAAFALGAGSSGGAAGLNLATAASDALDSVARPDLQADPVVDVVVLPNVTPELPTPEPPPIDPLAPTPEIRHGTLEIPAIGLSQSLFEGVTLTAINRGPSHWPGSAMPGELGNVVVAGHRTTYTRPFWDLHLLEPGDELVFTTDAGRFVYALTSIEIVEPEGLHILTQTNAHTATLFACHPRGSARQRIVGHFTQVEAEPTAG